MKLLVTGANGYLGQHLCIYLTTNKFEVIATGRSKSSIPAQHSIPYVHCELTDEIAVNCMIDRYKPDVIIHNAAMSKPDECHYHPKLCILNNVTVTDYLLKAAKNTNSRFIYLSTDFIFGENGPHSESDHPAPLNFYGECKLKAEQLVQKSGLKYAIVRPVFIYGPVWEGLRSTFIQWVQKNLMDLKTIKVVNDQIRTPTFVYDICKGIHEIITGNHTGVFHLAGKDLLSPYQMAVKTAIHLNLNPELIIPVDSSTFPEPVTRAKRSGLLIDKAIKQLNYQPLSFDEGLEKSFL